MTGVTLTQTLHGPMWTIDEDIWVSRCLRELGEHSQLEMQFIQMTLGIRGKEATLVDAGAYIGDLTIPMARCAKWVYAFEPQRAIREILQENLKMNGVTNVTVFPYALGQESETLGYTPCTESPGSTMLGLDAADESAECVTLDSLDLQVDLLKADVEGMELHLLAGALATLEKHRPILLLERDTVIQPGAQTLPKVFDCLDYDAYPMAFPLWRAENPRGAPNTFGTTASLMMLGVPRRH